MIRAAERRDSYVYLFFRTDGAPLYIGKGRRNRWREHYTRTTNPILKAEIKRAARDGLDLPLVFLHTGLSDAQALEYEVALIAAIGRMKDGGPLVNMTDGGDGAAGVERLEATIAKLRERTQSRWDGEWGAERKQEWSDRARRQASTPENRARLAAMAAEQKGKPGRPQTEEWKRMIGQAVAEANRRRVITEETREKLRAASKRVSENPEVRRRREDGYRRWAAENPEKVKEQRNPARAADGRFARKVASE